RVYGRTRASVLGELAEQAIQRRVSVAAAAPGEPCTAVPSGENCENPAGKAPVPLRAEAPEGTSNPRVGGSTPSGRAENGDYAVTVTHTCSRFSRLALAYAALSVGVLLDGRAACPGGGSPAPMAPCIGRSRGSRSESSSATVGRGSSRRMWLGCSDTSAPPMR